MTGDWAATDAGFPPLVAGGGVAYNAPMHRVSDFRWGRLAVRLLFAMTSAGLIGAAGGCAGLTLATLGTVAGAAGSAFATGKDIYRLGKLDTAEMARYDDALAATRAAAKDLRLAGKLDKQNPDGTADFSFEDDKGAAVGVNIERRSEGLVRIRVDVGFFGSEPTARLFLARLRANLPLPRDPPFGATPIDGEDGSRGS